MKFRFSFIIATTIFCAAITEIEAKASFHDYTVYKVVPNNEEQVRDLMWLQEYDNYDFWTDRIEVNGDVRIMVEPVKKIVFEKYLEEKHIEGVVVITNVQAYIDLQLKSAPVDEYSNARLGSFSWDRYHSLDAIYAWLDELETMYPNVVTVVEMGRSTEGRLIKGVKIDHRPNREKKFIGMYEGGLHAREWISPATVTWIIKEFLTSDSEEVKALARNLEWHIFPVVNPDGYEYTFTTHRMWRKNRNTENFQSCGPIISDDMSNGIDLNRNFGFMWNTVGASSNPCDNTFAGIQPFTEAESLSINNYVLRLNSTGPLIYYIAFHSFTQLIVIPYSHLERDDVNQIDNFADLYEIGVKSAEKLKERFNTEYRVGASHEYMYKMSGTSFDWVKQATNVPICYLFELRDMGTYGFLLPSNQIIPNNLEIMDALIEMDRLTLEKGYYSGASHNLVSLSVVFMCVFIGNLFL